MAAALMGEAEILTRLASEQRAARGAGPAACPRHSEPGGETPDRPAAWYYKLLNFCRARNRREKAEKGRSRSKKKGSKITGLTDTLATYSSPS